jgi:hypothetical protein
MDKIIYVRGNELGDNIREPSKIEFEVPEDMNIDEFKITCKRLAAAIGYMESNILDVFGTDEDIYERNNDWSEFISDLINSVDISHIFNTRDGNDNNSHESSER